MRFILGLIAGYVFTNEVARGKALGLANTAGLFTEKLVKTSTDAIKETLPKTASFLKIDKDSKTNDVSSKTE